jgi:hypothetical protein
MGLGDFLDTPPGGTPVPRLTPRAPISIKELIAIATLAALAILDALFATYGIPYAKMGWLGPWQNNGANQPTLDQVRSQLAADMAIKGCTYVDLYASGIPFSGGNSTDGIHATPQGATLLAAYATGPAFMTFTA